MVQRELARRDHVRDAIATFPEHQHQQHAACLSEIESQRRWESLRKAHRASRPQVPVSQQQQILSPCPSISTVTRLIRDGNNAQARVALRTWWKRRTGVITTPQSLRRDVNVHEVVFFRSEMRIPLPCCIYPQATRSRPSIQLPKPLHARHIVPNSFRISSVHVSSFAVGTCSHSTKKIYCHGRIRLGLELILVRFKPCFLKTDNASANAPGAECSIVKDMSDFLFFFCPSMSPTAAAVLRKLSMFEERSDVLFLKIKKRVVLSDRSSMCSCNTNAPWNSAASLLAIAAS